MIARNESCPCGSGKKHKKCCGGPVDTCDKQLSPRGMQRAFLYLIQNTCQREEVDCVTLSCKNLDSLPKDLVLAIGYNPKQDSFIFKPVKVAPKPLVVVPDRRIIV